MSPFSPLLRSSEGVDPVLSKDFYVVTTGSHLSSLPWRTVCKVMSQTRSVVLFRLISVLGSRMTTGTIVSEYSKSYYPCPLSFDYFFPLIGSFSSKTEGVK